MDSPHFLARPTTTALCRPYSASTPFRHNRYIHDAFVPSRLKIAARLKIVGAHPASRGKRMGRLVAAFSFMSATRDGSSPNGIMLENILYVVGRGEGGQKEKKSKAGGKRVSGGSRANVAQKVIGALWHVGEVQKWLLRFIRLSKSSSATFLKGFVGVNEPHRK